MLKEFFEGATEAERVCDPITLEIVRGALKSTLQEMEALIERTSMSPFVREKKDFHSGLYDGQGRLVYTSSFLGSDNLVNTVLEVYPRDEIKDGDIYWYNDCYASKGVVTHTPDQVFLTPVFWDGELIAYVEGWAHFNDIGGMRPGSLSSDCTEIFQEGIIVPPVKLADEGRISEELLRLFYRNSRFPEMVQGDVRALMAAIKLGKKRLEESAGRFGVERLEDAFDQLIERTATEVRARMRKYFPVGEYKTSETVDSDGQGNGPFKLRYTLSVTEDKITLDATASDDQSPGPVNLLLNPGSASGMLGNYVLAGDHRFIANNGQLRAVDEVKLRQGSILQPTFPAPLGYRGSTMMRNMVGAMGLVAVATKGHSNAAHSAYVIYYLRGQDEEGRYFLLSDGIGVGYGARPYADGNDAIYLTANENYPCEFVELVYPMRVKRYTIAQDTGGPGRWRGGCGVVRDMEVLAEKAMLSMRIDSIKTPPWGVNGGLAGRPGGCWINPGTPEERYVEGVSDGTMVHKGDVVRVLTGGGGGWGHPYDREAEQVLADVLDGFVSPASAHDDYGVVLSESGDAVDFEATGARRKDRPESKLFHQNGYKESLA